VKSHVLALAALALSSFCFAADAPAKKTNPDIPLPSTNCQFSFSTGTQNTFLRYCVTDTGNILGLESPEGHFMVPDDREGYGICDATGNVNYDDYGSAGESGSWGLPTVLSHTAKAVKIARTTGDGIWTLTQTITLMGGNTPMVKDTMTLKNNTTVPRFAMLLRFADTDIDGDQSNNLDATVESASAWNSVSAPNENAEAHGLTLQNVGLSRPTHQALAQNSPSGPFPCNPFAVFPPAPLVQVDGSLAVIYQAFVGPRASMTANVGYRPF
jgi:hypothetical protein